MCDAYIYQAAMYCEDCIAAIRENLDPPENPGDESSYDSDDYPKGPFDDGGGEADTPQHCDACQTFLENPLTLEGDTYVREAILEYLSGGRGSREVLEEWVDFYDVTVAGLLRHVGAQREDASSASA